MSREFFDENRDKIDTALRLLFDDPKLHRQSRLATVYEKRSGELLVEVLWTSFGPVVVYSNSGGGTSRNTVFVGPRQNRGNRAIAPLSGDADEAQVFFAASRRAAMYEIRRADLIRILGGDVDPATFRFAGDDAGALTFRRGVSRHR